MFPNKNLKLNLKRKKQASQIIRSNCVSTSGKVTGLQQQNKCPIKKKSFSKLWESFAAFLLTLIPASPQDGGSCGLKAAAWFPVPSLELEETQQIICKWLPMCFLPIHRVPCSFLLAFFWIIHLFSSLLFEMCIFYIFQFLYPY